MSTAQKKNFSPSVDASITPKQATMANESAIPKKGIDPKYPVTIDASGPYVNNKSRPGTLPAPRATSIPFIQDESSDAVGKFGKKSPLNSNNKIPNHKKVFLFFVGVVSDFIFIFPSFINLFFQRTKLCIIF